MLHAGVGGRHNLRIAPISELAPPPAVTIHGPGDLRAALAPRLPLTLLSARGAGGYGGALWWRALVAEARAQDIADILDCGDAPGHAMAALRCGQRLIVCDVGPAATALASAAASVGGKIVARPPALDLAAPGAARHLAAWLAHA